ncbi:MAG: AMP-binding protein [Candidatus Rokubacteria bacterium]|nr:AMP-binding protein [Candidatus Rokubacteria bacterium]
MTLDTFPKLVRDNAERLRDKVAVREKDYGIWQSHTWGDYLERGRLIALGLASLGFRRGDKTAIVGDNRPELYWAVMATQALGGVPVPLYQDSIERELAFIVDHAEARFAIAEDQEQVDKLLRVRQTCPKLEVIVYKDPRGMRAYSEPFLLSLQELEEAGRKFAIGHPTYFDDEIAQGTAADVGVICYTSGTTGQPKGTILSHGALMATARNAKEIAPTYFFAPPRIWESILTTVMIRVEDASWPKRRLVHFFLGVAQDIERAGLLARPVAFWKRLLRPLGHVLVYGPLRDNLGMRRIRRAYTAGEAIGPEIFVFFRALGVNVKQLYGMTESSGLIAIHKDGDVRLDTVGTPLPEVEIRLTEQGEIMFRGPGVFSGYYKNPEATSQTIEDGWVHTGDAGFIDADGHLKIIDRAKDVSRLAGGTMFAPKYLENKLKFSPYVKEAVCIGQGRDHVTALINIDLQAVGNWAERRGVAYTSYTDLSQKPEVYELIAQEVARVNRSLLDEELLRGAQIRRFLILHKELDPDDEEITRTRKVRRGYIAQKYAALIEALYSDRDRVQVEAKVTYEDGRTGTIRADVRIRDVEPATGQGGR